MKDRPDQLLDEAYNKLKNNAKVLPYPAGYMTDAEQLKEHASNSEFVLDKLNESKRQDPIIDTGPVTVGKPSVSIPSLELVGSYTQNGDTVVPSKNITPAEYGALKPIEPDDSMYPNRRPVKQTLLGKIKAVWKQIFSKENR